MALTKASYSMVSSAPLSVLDYGASPSKSAVDNTAAFVAAVTDAIAQNKPLKIPAGTYALTADGVNFAGQGLVVYGEGAETVLQYTGTGRGFVVNGGTAGVGVGAMRIENLLIVGGPNITDGFYQTGVFRSVFRNIEVRECTNNAFTILHGVSNQYESLKFSTNEAAQTTTPTNGLVLNNSGVGYYTSNCTFINCIMEGYSGRGCYIVDGSGNVFLGGTFEAVNKGLEISASSIRNKFVSVWFEANAINDAEIYGNSNIFDGCYFGSASSQLNVQLITAGGTVFNGGFVRAANMQTASSDTAFYGCGLADNPAFNFQGLGSYKRYGCIKLDVNAAVVGSYLDSTGLSGTWTPSFVASGGGTQGAATLAFGRYVQFGNICYVTARMNIAKGTLTGAVSVAGFPLLSSGLTNYYQFIPAGEWQNINLATGFSAISCRFAPSSQIATLIQCGDAGISQAINVADFSDPMIFEFSGCYEIE